MSKLNHFIFLSYLVLFLHISLSYSLTTKLNILPGNPNTYMSNRKLSQYQQFLSAAQKKSDLPDKVCSKVFSTYQALGNSSMSIYSSCQNKYELLGRNIFRNEEPFCYSNLHKFFCNYYYEDSNTEKCSNKNLIKFILTVLSNCFQDDNNKETDYNCTGIDFLTYKVNDSEKFCKEASSKTLIDIKGKKKIYQTVTLESDTYETCRNVVNVYNSCVDSDNLLYPSKNYEKCFEPSNALYQCNKVMYFEEKEKKICEDYVLPSFASMTLHDEMAKQSESSFCDGYQDKMSSQYDLYIRAIDEVIENTKENINKNERIIEYGNQLKEIAKSILDKISTILKKWNDMLLQQKEKNINKDVMQSIIKDLEKINKYSTEINDYIESIKEKSNDDSLPEIKKIYQQILNSLDEINTDIEQIKQREIIDDEDNELIDITVIDKQFGDSIHSFKDFLKSSMVLLIHNEEEKKEGINNEKKKIEDYKEYKLRIEKQKQFLIELY